MNNLKKKKNNNSNKGIKFKKRNQKLMLKIKMELTQKVKTSQMNCYTGDRKTKMINQMKKIVNS